MGFVKGCKLHKILVKGLSWMILRSITSRLSVALFLFLQQTKELIDLQGGFCFLFYFTDNSILRPSKASLSLSLPASNIFSLKFAYWKKRKKKFRQPSHPLPIRKKQGLNFHCQILLPE